MVTAVKIGGLVLDLQVIRVNPRVESEGRLLCEIDGEPLFRKSDAAARAIDSLIARGILVEEAIDDHDVRKHYPNGADLVDDFVGKERRLPPESIAFLSEWKQTCVVRERCRLRRLRSVSPIVITHPRD
jgi:hypothetical protein